MRASACLTCKELVGGDLAMIRAKSAQARLLLSIAFCALPGPVLGQEPAAEDESQGAFDEVIVLGSRLTRSNMDSPAPVTVLDADTRSRWLRSRRSGCSKAAPRRSTARKQSPA